MKVTVEPIYLRLPYPPSVNGLFVNGRKGRFKSQNYKLWQAEAALTAKTQCGARIEGPYALAIHAVRPDRRKRDLGNIEKAISDLLVHCGFVGDDSEAQHIELQWIEKGPPVWVRIVPCKRWAVDFTKSFQEA